MKEIPRFYKGSKENPINNIRDLEIALIGRKNYIIYVKNIMLNQPIQQEYYERNIDLKEVKNK